MSRAADDQFEKHYVELFVVAQRVAMRVLGDRTEAEDVAAEAMVRAMSSWTKVRGFRVRWVSRVALNLAIDVQRRRQRRGASPGSDDAGPDPTERVMLASALKKLPGRQREAVVLRHMAGLTGQATAKAMGLSPQTVKTHLERGLATLRTDLGAKADEGISDVHRV